MHIDDVANDIIISEVLCFVKCKYGIITSISLQTAIVGSMMY